MMRVIFTEDQITDQIEVRLLNGLYGMWSSKKITLFLRSGDAEISKETLLTRNYSVFTIKSYIHTINILFKSQNIENWLIIATVQPQEGLLPLLLVSIV